MSLQAVALVLVAQAGGVTPAGDVGSGKIEGGWGYVWAAWLITWAVIVIYALFLWSRERGEDRRTEP